MNVLLIGMPGCGKSAFGKSAAAGLDLEYVDTDSEIESREGTISKIFEEKGESYFRALETRVLADCLKKDKCVISTGGGIVNNSENIEKAKEAGAYIIFIDRPLELILGDIDTSARPLLKDGADRLRELYDERYDKYRAAANAMVINDGAFGAALNDILRIIRNAVL